LFKLEVLVAEVINMYLNKATCIKCKMAVYKNMLDANEHDYAILNEI
jgi:hypothetical protein